MQPHYLPWPGYFDLIQRADIFIFHDDIKFNKQSWQQRNRIALSEELVWLSVPVQKGRGTGSLINQLKVDDSQNWRHRHLAKLQHAYSASPGFDVVYRLIERALDPANTALSTINQAFILGVLDLLGIKRTIHCSSEWGLPGSRSERLLNLCDRVGATSYLSPRGSRAYIEEDGVFAAAGFPVFYQQYKTPVYRVFPPLKEGESPSFVDALMTLGPERAAKILGEDGEDAGE
jgi:hypothetical protein